MARWQGIWVVAALMSLAGAGRAQAARPTATIETTKGTIVI